MRVIEPSSHANKLPKPKKKTKLSKFFLVILIIILAFLVLLVVYKEKSYAPSEQKTQNNQPLQNTQNFKTGVLKQFSADEFRDLYNSFAYPNTEIIKEQTSITNNLTADQRIRKLAEARGYRLRSAPVSDSFVTISPGNQLQRRAADDWTALFEAAKKDQINLSVSEGYRSADDQKVIFTSRLEGLSPAAIAKGSVDSQVDKVLEKTAPPGYSRHHSGYTIDLVCDNQPYAKFESTICFEWLSNDNYKNAKLAGWIPSYPEGTKQQGPEPESWEYVWAGKDSLLK